MKKFFILSVLLLLSSTTQGDNVRDERQWRYTKDISGIKIFQREGISEGFFEFLAITTVNRPSEIIEDAIFDTASNRFWMADCIYSEQLARLNRDELIAYYITDPPWPVRRRDSIIRVKKKAVHQKTVFYMSSLKKGAAEEYKPVNSEYTRIYRMDGIVTLEGKKPGETEITFFVAGESGGNVPDLVTRIGGWVIPYKTLSGLKKYLSLQYTQ